MHRLARAGDTDLAMTEYGLAVLIPCRVCNGTDKRQEYLRRVCGLAGDELSAGFDEYWTQTRERQTALGCARDVLARNGWLTLDGQFGTGKTYLLQAIVNEARLSGQQAVYTTMARLLDHLRDAFKPGHEVTFSGLWDVVCKSKVLCIDEVEKFSPTPWAEERLFDMANRRYQDWSQLATVFATNDLAGCPGYLKSRMLDGRFRVVKFSAGDVRPGLRR